MMKNTVFNILVLLLIAVSPTIAEEKAVSEWGAATNGLQMSIYLKNDKTKIAINQRVNFSIPMRNGSTNETFMVNSGDWAAGKPGRVSVTVISPSGKDISLIENMRPVGSVRFFEPNETVEYNIESSRVCEFDEIGTYKIVAKHLVRRFDKKAQTSELFLVVSNPLYVSVVPKVDSTNNPSRHE